MSTLSLSVVTICFNNLAELKETMESIHQQSRKVDEHWIIDGSSTNEIAEYLKETSLPAYTRWVSEPDEGISDALNKGVKRCSGEVIHLLHSADTYYNRDVVEKVMTVFEQNPSLSWTHGQYEQQMAGVWVITGARFQPNKLHYGMQKVSHPTMFVKHSLYEKYGLFDKQKKLAMDYDFLIRIRQEPFQYLPFPIVRFAPGGASNQDWKGAFKEVMASYSKHIGPKPKRYLGWIKQYAVQQLLHSPIGKWWLNRKRNKT